jgi:hypothetical protein
VRRQAAFLAAILSIGAFVSGCGERGITNPAPTPGKSHPGFDTSIYPGDATMSAWRYPASPYEWVGYYLQAPCHRDPSWMGKRATLTAMGWGLAVLFVGQQTFDGVPDVKVPLSFDLLSPETGDSLPRARGTVVTPSTPAQLQSGAVTCSRTLLTTEQGSFSTSSTWM